VVRLHCQFFDTCIELSNISDSSRQVVLGRKDFPCLKEELLISRQQFKIDVTDFVSITSVPPPPPPPPPLTQHPPLTRPRLDTNKLRARVRRKLTRDMLIALHAMHRMEPNVVGSQSNVCASQRSSNQMRATRPHRGPGCR
jgi:hypothetical protein